MDNNTIQTLSQIDTKGFHCINEIVSGVRLRLKDKTQQRIKEYTQYAIDCLRELNISDATTIKAAMLTMNQSSRSCSFPSDMIDFTRIAIKINGCLYTLGNNENLELPTAQQCGIPIRDICNDNFNPDAIQGGFFWAAGVWDGYNYTPMYSVGGGFSINYYRCDRKNRMFYFDGDIMNYPVYIEYISDGVNLSGETIVPTIMLDVLRLYTIWQVTAYDPKANQYDKEKSQKLFEEARSKWEWRKFRESFSLQEYNNTMWAEQKLSVHR